MSRPVAAAILMALLLLVPVRGGSAAAVPVDDTPSGDPSTLKYSDLSISFPQPEKFMLSNGLMVYLFVDNELPIIDLAFNLKAGSIYDPPGKAGLAHLATLILRTGGTSKMTPDEVDEALEFMPARVRIGAGDDMVSGSLSTLGSEFPDALRIVAGMLRSPRFDPARIEVEKGGLVEEIRRRWDNPAAISSYTFSSLVYGATSPWARLATLESINAIDRDDLTEFHRIYVHPNNMMLGVAGHFEPAAMKKLLGEVFGSWKRAKVRLPAVPRVKDTGSAGVYLVDRPLTQSAIGIGHLGVNRFDPDKFPLKILNYILGEGGFSSRLMKEVRSTRGLAYSVSGGVGMESDRGLFEISSRTRGDATVEAIEVIRGILIEMREEGPTEREIRQAIDASINSFVFSLEGTTPFMRAYLYYDAYNYPADFLQTYRDNLSKVTRKQVLRAARKHIDPDAMVILVVGNGEELLGPLADMKLGKPRVVPPGGVDGDP